MVPSRCDIRYVHAPKRAEGGAEQESSSLFLVIPPLSGRYVVGEGLLVRRGYQRGMNPT